MIKKLYVGLSLSSHVDAILTFKACKTATTSVCSREAVVSVQLKATWSLRAIYRVDDRCDLIMQDYVREIMFERPGELGAVFS
jgi:hypothetical protein